MIKIKNILIFGVAALVVLSASGNVSYAINKYQVYQEAKVAFESAKQSEESINKAIISLKDSITAFSNEKINYENFKNNPEMINEIISNYQDAKTNFVTAKDSYFPLLQEYQTKLDEYNKSGAAPDSNITVAHNAENFESNSQAVLDELDHKMPQEIEQITAYGDYYKAKMKLEKDFEIYTKKWSAEPNSTLSTTWPEIINSYGNDDFSPIGFSIEDMQAMNTKAELDRVLDKYKEKTNEVVNDIIDYSTYLREVYDEWNDDKTEFNNALKEFNSKTGNSVTVKYMVDRLISNIDSSYTAAESAVTSNNNYLDIVRTFYVEGDNVYQLIYDTKSSISVRLGATGPNTLGVISQENAFEVSNIAINIDFVQVYELSSPDDSDVEVPNTGGGPAYLKL